MRHGDHGMDMVRLERERTAAGLRGEPRVRTAALAQRSRRGAGIRESAHGRTSTQKSSTGFSREEHRLPASHERSAPHVISSVATPGNAGRSTEGGVLVDYLVGVAARARIGVDQKLYDCS